MRRSYCLCTYLCTSLFYFRIDYKSVTDYLYYNKSVTLNQAVSIVNIQGKKHLSPSKSEKGALLCQLIMSFLLLWLTLIQRCFLLPDFLRQLLQVLCHRHRQVHLRQRLLPNRQLFLQQAAQAFQDVRRTCRSSCSR